MQLKAQHALGLVYLGLKVHGWAMAGNVTPLDAGVTMVFVTLMGFT